MGRDNLLRVTQMNAVFLDKELLNIFKQHIQEFLKYLPPGLTAKYEAEMHFLLQLAVLKYSILSHDATFGQKLLSIKYSNITSTKKGFMVFAEFFEYFKERLSISKPSHNLNQLFHKLNLLIQLLRFWNISVFLRNGKKPLLIERILCLNQVYSKDNAYRHYEDKYMTRELIWNGFIEVLVYILPLINYHKITRKLRHLNPLHKKPTALSTKRVVMTSDTTCAQCEQRPILPHHMGCSHIFCYYCLKGHQAADIKYECPKCEFYSGDVICEQVNVI